MKSDFISGISGPSIFLKKSDAVTDLKLKMFSALRKYAPRSTSQELNLLMGVIASLEVDIPNLKKFTIYVTSVYGSDRTDFSEVYENLETLGYSIEFTDRMRAY